MQLSRIVVTARNPRALAGFWADLLGGTVVEEAAGRVRVALPGAPGLPGLCFGPVGPGGSGGRVRLDLVVPDVAVLRGRAGVRAVGGAGGPRVSVTDPEGNELCFHPEEPGRVELPAAVAKVRVVFTDADGRVLLVRLRSAAGGPHWGLPGGTVEAGAETPRAAAVREVAEELGLDRAPGRLLAVDWVHRPGDRPRAVQVFDGGPLAEPELARIRLDPGELAEWRLCGAGEAAALLPPAGWGQLSRALAARAPGRPPAELVDGAPAGGEGL
ncbi:ADP-ribose pyrophosphatase YjhB (NUDIX family) [Kitasatospora sp. SolWspMP-SS2h]|uniref:NUDIX domain-containing protein n=1 Tax=Kitasatospora sp. SolWspMP-SS2h TaxID=1305729 RepID=UPI000DBA4FD4|nr:NUDIX domain-containing protein [Kitasatospora sp. SolWspMP-SS2h]RAJ42421.1 ADP-ribose pyrophosphatase YjhB (NUDIX family) [Kitasatospora sp. SolWspMP-SS2h]